MKLFKTYLSIPVEHSKGSEMAIIIHLDKIVQRPAKLFTYSVIGLLMNIPILVLFERKRIHYLSTQGYLGKVSLMKS